MYSFGLEIVNYSSKFIADNVVGVQTKAYKNCCYMKRTVKI